MGVGPGMLIATASGVFLIPVFFINVGIRFDLEALGEPGAALLTIQLIAIAFIVKVLPSLVLTLRGLTLRESLAAGSIGSGDKFGSSVAHLGDLDGDGINDLAVGSYKDDDGGADRGAVYVLFLNADGTVKAEQKISDTLGGFTAVLDNADEFGIAGGAEVEVTVWGQDNTVIATFDEVFSRDAVG